MPNCSCACVYVDVNEAYDTIKEETAVSTGEELCGECNRRIKLGEEYELYQGRSPSEGEVRTHLTCKDCLSVREAFFCDWMFGHLWEDLSEHVYEVAGEITTDCLLRLTPWAREGVLELIDEEFDEEEGS